MGFGDDLFDGCCFDISVSVFPNGTDGFVDDGCAAGSCVGVLNDFSCA